MSTTDLSGPHSVSAPLWQQFAPEADAADRRERRLTRRVAAAILAAAVLGTTAHFGGVTTSRLETSGGGGGFDTTTGKAFADVQIRNAGWLTERLSGLTTTVPGVVIDSAARLTPTSLSPGGHGVLHVTFHISDCGEASAWVTNDRTTTDDFRVLTERPWGTTSADAADLIGPSVTDLIQNTCIDPPPGGGPLGG